MPLVSSPTPPYARPHVSPVELLRIWLRIGATSFGGGAATQLLIYDQFVTRRRLMSPDEFAEAWALVQMSPGVNLIAMTMVIGARLGGAIGVVVSTLGMLTPAVGLTIAMTALYSRVRDVPAIVSALHGLAPALVGVSAAFMWRLVQTPMAVLRRHGTGAAAVGIGVIVASAALAAAGLPLYVGYVAGAVGLGIVYGAVGVKGAEETTT